MKKALISLSVLCVLVAPMVGCAKKEEPAAETAVETTMETTGAEEMTTEMAPMSTEMTSDMAPMTTGQ